MAKPRYGKNEKVKKGTGAYKRARKRAKAQGRTGLLKGGITGGEARSLRRQSPAGQADKPQGVQGGVRRRALDRLDYLEDHGGAPGGVRTKDGISRREARKIRGAWQTERRHDPLTPRSGRDIVRNADAMTQLEFGDYENELNRERQYEQGRQNVLYGPNGWMQQYHDQVAQAAQRQQVAEMAFQAGASAQMQQANLTAQQAMQPQPGATTTPSGAGAVDPNVQAQAQQAAQARMSMAQNAAIGLAARGASNVQAVNELAIAASQQSQEGLRESQARMAKVDQLARELSVKKGAYRTDAIRQGQEAERTYDLSRSAFGLDVAEANEDARANRARERNNRAALRAQVRENNRHYRQWQAEFGADRADEMWDQMHKDRQYRLDVDKFGETKAQNRWNRRHGGDGPGGAGKYTQSQKNSNQSKRREASQAWHQFRGNKKFKNMTDRQKIEFIRQRENVDPLIVRSVIAPETLSAKQRAELKRMGIPVKGTSQPGNAPSQYDSRGGDPSRRT